MARTCQIQKEKKIMELNVRYQEKRKQLKDIIKKYAIQKKQNINEQAASYIHSAYMELRALPRSSSFTRISRRCLQTGRKRSFCRLTGTSRIAFRQDASSGKLMGFRKTH